MTFQPFMKMEVSIVGSGLGFRFFSPLQVFFTGKETDRWLWTGFHFPGMDQMDGIPKKPGRYPVQRTR